ncbi:MAG: alanine dehydrogenase [Alphaproteobacteria bacterium]|nr:alanine dehydrogenase [Alphaproteobacteria bacterium]
MRIGVPTEVKEQEYRVGLTPASVRELTARDHEVVVQAGCGHAIGFDDGRYQAAGASVVDSAAEVFETAEMVVKVKEPQAKEIAMLREGQVLFTYLHLAPDPEQTNGLVESGCIAIAYETVTDRFGRLPLLAPMSEVAGRMSIQAAAHCLEKEAGGSGILMGGVPGVPPARVLVIGGGVVGTHAARMARGLGARVTMIDRSLARLHELEQLFAGSVTTVFSTAEAIEEYVANADAVVGAVLLPGAEAPKLVTRKMVTEMRLGSVLVDVAIDQGGCFETSRPTTHTEPTYVIDGVVHYCVANMPGAVPRTSTRALNNATLPYVQMLADQGYRRALAEDPYFLPGLNVHRGQVTIKAVADAQKLPFVQPMDALGL